MDGHRPTDALTDSTLEREVESLLAVEPSPNYLARVRARVAEEPAPVGWRFRWEFAAAAATVVILATAVIWRSSNPARSIDGSAQAPLVAEKATPPAVSSPTERVVRPPVPSIESERRPGSGIREHQTTETSERSGLVAIIASEDTKGFQSLLASIRKPDVVLVLHDDAAGPALLETPSIAIAPIDIEPVPPVAQLEGGIE